MSRLVVARISNSDTLITACNALRQQRRNKEKVFTPERRCQSVSFLFFHVLSKHVAERIRKTLNETGRYEFSMDPASACEKSLMTNSNWKCGTGMGLGAAAGDWFTAAAPLEVRGQQPPASLAGRATRPRVAGLVGGVSGVGVGW